MKYPKRDLYDNNVAKNLDSIDKSLKRIASSLEKLSELNSQTKESAKELLGLFEIEEEK